MKRFLIALMLPLSLWAQNDPLTWQKHVVLDTLIGIKKLAIGNLDLDANRDMDIALTANPESNGSEDSTLANVLWLKNTGDEIFEAHVIDYKLAGARGLAVGDLNGDGWPEVAAGSRSDTSPLMIYKNDSTPDVGTWQRIAVQGSAPNHYEILVVDLDRDGRLDIVDGFGDDANFGSANSGSVIDSIRFLKNTSSLNQLSFRPKLIVQTSSPSAMAVADYDRDGLRDVAGLSWINYASLIPAAGENFKWWAQQSDTTFLEMQEIIDSYGGNDLQAADMNDDGYPDLVAAGYKARTLDLWLNDGTGTFATRLTIDQNLAYPRHVSVQDVDSDGDMDIALTIDQENKIVWYENDGLLNFTRHVLDSAFTYAYFVHIFDLDGDGDQDVIGTAQDAGVLAWWENGQAEELIAAAGAPDTLRFNQNQLLIKYDPSFPGGMTSAHFNHGKNPDSLQMAAGIERVAGAGLYTIVSHAAFYSATAVFKYDSIAQWQSLRNIDDSRLRICYWNDSLAIWQLAGNGGQAVDTAKKEISVLDISSEFHKYARFTLCLSAGPSMVENDPAQLVPVKIEHRTYPNPFNSQIWIHFTVPQAAQARLQNVRLSIYNLLGQQVKTIYEGYLPAGAYRFLWNGNNHRNRAISSGWYFYRLSVGAEVVQGKILLIR
ncbi:T9SS type A sorting domain-containing protein [Calditrichota bacterium LG25]